MLVFVEDAPETVVPVYVKAGVDVGRGRGRRQCLQRPGVGDSLVGPVAVIELLELAQGVQQMPLIPDQGPVEQLAAAGQHPALHDRVHSRHLVGFQNCA